MSAFVVKDRTINQVITWLQQQDPDTVYNRKVSEAYDLDPLDLEGWTDIGKAVWELNCMVVRQSYEDADECGMIPASFTPKCEQATLLQVYKSLRCWLYQCEGDICETSILFSIMREIADCLAHDIICGLDGYKDAAWDWRGPGGTKLIH